ncbi:MAG: hypothetical protein QM730_15870 [Anaerolineales bacterium]
MESRKWRVGRWDRRAGRDTVHGAGGQGGDDVRVVEWEGEIGVSTDLTGFRGTLCNGNSRPRTGCNGQRSR